MEKASGRLTPVSRSRPPELPEPVHLKVQCFAFLMVVVVVVVYDSHALLRYR